MTRSNVLSECLALKSARFLELEVTEKFPIIIVFKFIKDTKLRLQSDKFPFLCLDIIIALF